MHHLNVCLFFFVCLYGGSVCEELLEVYIIPHSHCDVGWKKTVDEYYNQQVHWILHNVTESISRSTYPGVVRKFNWDVQAFFQMWWKDLSESKKFQVNQLIQERKLDFIGFGWVQSDEAVADLFARVVQMTEGHNYIAKKFPSFVDTPRIAWQIDPFGASSITPVLFSLAGYDALVHERIPRAQQTEWKIQHRLQYEWTGNPSSLTSPLWSHNLGDPTNDYCTPGDPPPPGGGPYGFDWEADDDGDPNKDPVITPENIQARAEVLNIQMTKEHKWIQEGVPLLFPFGCDFRFQKAEAQFTNMDQLIYYINSNSTLYNIHLQYGLVSEWYEAVQATQKTWPAYQGDFLPYNNKQNDFWSGFFTSRPDIKRSSRYSESLLRFAEIIHAFALLKNPTNQAILEPSLNNLLDSARQNISICQHHDAITGTSPDTTMEDYLHRLRDSDLSSATVMEETAQVVLCKKSGDCSEDISFSLYESAPPTHALPVIDILPQLSIPLVVNNPLAWNQNQFIQIQTNSSYIQLSYANGTHIPVQVTPSGNNNFVVGFILPMNPLEMLVLQLQQASSPVQETSRTVVTNKTVEISNEYFNVVVDTSTGLIRTVRDEISGNILDVDQQLIEYYSPHSSAYSMKPSSWRVLPPDASVLEVTVVQGSLFSQIDVTYNSYIQWSGRLIHGNRPDVGRKLDYSVLIGPVANNTEVAMRFNTNWDTRGVWYSDNGLAIDEHHRVHLPYMDAMGIGSNFHSLKNTAFIRNIAEGLEFTITTAQSAGVSSLNDGQLEIVMHRRCGSWDDRSQVHLFYQLMFSDSSSLELYRNQNMEQLEYPPIVLLGSPQTSGSDILLDHFQPVSKALPQEIHLFSLSAANSLAFGKVGNCTSATVAFRLQNLSSNNTISVDTSDWIQNCSLCGQEERGLTLLPPKNTDELSLSLSSTITLPPFSLQSYVSSFEC